MTDNGFRLKQCAAGPGDQQGKPQLAGNSHLHPAQSSRLTIASTGARTGSLGRLPPPGQPTFEASGHGRHPGAAAD